MFYIIRILKQHERSTLGSLERSQALLKAGGANGQPMQTNRLRNEATTAMVAINSPAGIPKTGSFRGRCTVV